MVHLDFLALQTKLVISPKTSTFHAKYAGSSYTKVVHFYFGDKTDYGRKLRLPLTILHALLEC